MPIGLDASRIGSPPRRSSRQSSTARIDGPAPSYGSARPVSASRPIFSADLAATLDDRWGLLVEPGGSAADRVVHVLDAGRDGWLAPPSPGERYRLECGGERGRRVVTSYAFAIADEPGNPLAFRLGLTRDAAEPVGRTLDNVARWVVARLALDDGGFALHAAAVVLDGRAFVFAGPSRAGKSTAVAASRPAESLGDDFAALICDGPGRWWTSAVPFDNSERVHAVPHGGPFPVAAAWRLAHGPALRVQALRGPHAAAALLGCAAFPWALPDQREALADHVERFVRERGFGVLQFPLGIDLATELLARC
jgi:hypothetical protein